eukprot:PhM_4_TR16099/c0_g1_i1/m.90192
MNNITSSLGASLSVTTTSLSLGGGGGIRSPSPATPSTLLRPGGSVGRHHINLNLNNNNNNNNTHTTTTVVVSNSAPAPAPVFIPGHILASLPLEFQTKFRDLALAKLVLLFAPVLKRFGNRWRVLRGYGLTNIDMKRGLRNNRNNNVVVTAYAPGSVMPMFFGSGASSSSSKEEADGGLSFDCLFGHFHLTHYEHELAQQLLRRRIFEIRGETINPALAAKKEILCVTDPISRLSHEAFVEMAQQWQQELLEVDEMRLAGLAGEPEVEDWELVLDLDRQLMEMSFANSSVTTSFRNSSPTASQQRRRTHLLNHQQLKRDIAEVKKEYRKVYGTVTRLRKKGVVVLRVPRDSAFGVVVVTTSSSSSTTTTTPTGPPPFLFTYDDFDPADVPSPEFVCSLSRSEDRYVYEQGRLFNALLMDYTQLMRETLAAHQTRLKRAYGAWSHELSMLFYAKKLQKFYRAWKARSHFAHMRRRVHEKQNAILDDINDRETALEQQFLHRYATTIQRAFRWYCAGNILRTRLRLIDERIAKTDYNDVNKRDLAAARIQGLVRGVAQRRRYTLVRLQKEATWLMRQVEEQVAYKRCVVRCQGVARGYLSRRQHHHPLRRQLESYIDRLHEHTAATVIQRRFRLYFAIATKDRLQRRLDAAWVAEEEHHERVRYKSAARLQGLCRIFQAKLEYRRRQRCVLERVETLVYERSVCAMMMQRMTRSAFARGRRADARRGVDEHLAAMERADHAQRSAAACSIQHTVRPFLSRIALARKAHAARFYIDCLEREEVERAADAASRIQSFVRGVLKGRVVRRERVAALEQWLYEESERIEADRRQNSIVIQGAVRMFLAKLLLRRRQRQLSEAWSEEECKQERRRHAAASRIQALARLHRTRTATQQHVAALHSAWVANEQMCMDRLRCFAATGFQALFRGHCVRHGVVGLVDALLAERNARRTAETELCIRYDSVYGAVRIQSQFRASRCRAAFKRVRMNAIVYSNFMLDEHLAHGQCLESHFLHPLRSEAFITLSGAILQRKFRAGCLRLETEFTRQRSAIRAEHRRGLSILYGEYDYVLPQDDVVSVFFELLDTNPRVVPARKEQLMRRQPSPPRGTGLPPTDAAKVSYSNRIRDLLNMQVDKQYQQKQKNKYNKQSNVRVLSPAALASTAPPGSSCGRSSPYRSPPYHDQRQQHHPQPPPTRPPLHFTSSASSATATPRRPEPPVRDPPLFTLDDTTRLYRDQILARARTFGAEYHHQQKAQPSPPPRQPQPPKVNTQQVVDDALRLMRQCRAVHIDRTDTEVGGGFFSPAKTPRRPASARTASSASASRHGAIITAHVPSMERGEVKPAWR